MPFSGLQSLYSSLDGWVCEPNEEEEAELAQDPGPGADPFLPSRGVPKALFCHGFLFAIGALWCVVGTSSPAEGQGGGIPWTTLGSASIVLLYVLAFVGCLTRASPLVGASLIIISGPVAFLIGFVILITVWCCVLFGISWWAGLLLGVGVLELVGRYVLVGAR